MDDLKVYKADLKELQATLSLIEGTAAAISMELRGAKCERQERGGVTTITYLIRVLPILGRGAANGPKAKRGEEESAEGIPEASESDIDV